MGRIVRAPGDFLAGVIFAAVGVASLVIGRGYRLGSLLSMGPGYFPRIVGVLLTAFGLIVAIAALRADNEGLDAWRLRPIVLVTAAIVAFGFCLERYGLVIASMVLVVVACFADRGRKIPEAIGVAVLLTLIAWVVFVKGLEMPMLVWPEFGSTG
jgi:hypothetical protein